MTFRERMKREHPECVSQSFGGGVLGCPYCGSTHVEEHGMMAGDFIWWLCRDCGAVIDKDLEKRMEDDLK